jgi:hypothetical protein
MISNIKNDERLERGCPLYCPKYKIEKQLMEACMYLNVFSFMCTYFFEADASVITRFSIRLWLICIEELGFQ